MTSARTKSYAATRARCLTGLVLLTWAWASTGACQTTAARAAEDLRPPVLEDGGEDPRERAGRLSEQRAENLEWRDDLIIAQAEYLNALREAAAGAAEMSRADGGFRLKSTLAWARVAWLLEKSHDLSGETGDSDSWLAAARPFWLPPAAVSAAPGDPGPPDAPVAADASDAVAGDAARDAALFFESIPRDLRTRAAWLSLRLHRRRGEARAVAEAARVLGFPPRWRVAGPFGQEADGGFDAPLGPEREAYRHDAVHTGAFGAARWKNIEAVDPSGVLDLAARMRPRRQAAAYASVFPRFAAEREVLLWIGADGPFALWLDGRLLAREAAADATGDPDQYVFVIRPSAGPRHILIKTAPSPVDDPLAGAPRWSLALRITDFDGAPLPDLAWTDGPETVSDDAQNPDAVDASAVADVARAAGPRENPPPPPPESAPRTRPENDAVRVLWNYVREHAGDHRRAYYLGSLLTLRGWSPGPSGGDAREAWVRVAMAGAPDKATYRLALARALAGSARSPGRDPDEREREFNIARQLYESVLEQYGRDRRAESTADAPTPADAAASVAADASSADASFFAPDRSDDPVAARIELGRLALEAWNHPERALAHADAALAANPSAHRARALRARAYAAMGWEAEAKREWAELARHFPEWSPARLAVGRDALAGSRPKTALAEFEAVLRREAHPDARAGAVEALVRLGRAEEAGQILRERLAAFPLDENALRLAAALAERSFAPESWLAAVDAALAIAPRDPEMLTARGDALLALGRPADADAAWARAARQVPAAPELLARREAYGRENQSPVTRIGDLAAWVKAQPPAALAPVAGYELLLYELVREVDGALRRTTWHVVARVLTRAGADELARETVDFGPGTAGRVRTVRVLGQDGEVREIPGVAGWTGGAPVRFLPALRPGEVVEWRVELERRLPPEFSGHLGELFLFPQSAPARRIRFALEVPDRPALHTRSLNGAPEPDVSSGAGGRALYSWEMHNLPMRPDEPAGAPPGESVPQVQAGTFADWDEFARWYWRLAGPQYVAPPELRRLAAGLAEQHPTPVERLEAAHDWIVRRFQPAEWRSDRHGFKPRNASDILARRFADCKDRSLLLCLLAREFGFDAAPALVRGVWADGGGVGGAGGAGGGRGVEDFTLPLINHFNHCVVRVMVDGQPVILDATARHRLAGELPYAIAGALALAVTPEGADWVRLAEGGPGGNGWKEETTLSLSADGSLSWTQRVQGSGLVAAFLRSRLERPADQAAFVREWTARLGAAADAGKPKGRAEFVDHGADGASYTLLAQSSAVAARSTAAATWPSTIRADASADASDALPPFGSRRGLRLAAPPVALSGTAGVDAPLPRRWSDFAVASERAGDLTLPLAFFVDRVVRINWPDGWRAAPLPADVHLAESFGELRCAYAAVGDGVVVRFSLSLPNPRIAAADYGRFRRFCALADRLGDLAVFLEPGSP